MDIAAVSLVNSQLEVRSTASMLVLKKAMEAAQQNSQALVDTAAKVPVSPTLGHKIDIKV